MNGLTSARNPRGEGRIAQKAIEGTNEHLEHLFNTGLCTHLSTHGGGVGGAWGDGSNQ